MKKWPIMAVAILLLSFTSIVYAVDSKVKTSDQKEGLIVKNLKGEHIGTSKHVLIDSLTGHIIFIIVSLSERSPKEIAVPLGAFSIDKGKGVLILNVTKKDLAAAPEYNGSTLIDQDFAERVYQFFGIAPPWTYEVPKEET